MVDTVYGFLLRVDADGVDFLKESGYYLDNVSEHRYADGETQLVGWCEGLKVIVCSRCVKIVEGSLCKWALGNNYEVMSRADIQLAFEALSDMLHLPMEKMIVTRLDVANNIETSHPVNVYFNHLGSLRYAHRLLQPNSLYYQRSSQTLCLYDKNCEQRSKRDFIPEEYRDKHIMRIEHRYTRRLSSQCGVEKLRAEMLYDAQFYNEVVRRWHSMYKSIEKVNDVTIDFINVKTKKALYLESVALLVGRLGEVSLYKSMEEAQKCGELTSKQMHDLREVVKEACKVSNGFTTRSELIKELDAKVEEAALRCQ